MGLGSPPLAANKTSRFEFGDNWRNFLDVLDENRVLEASRSLQRLLSLEHMTGKRFLDVGCGSGLFSLAAARLEASFVHSFDVDPASVECARELRRRWLPGATHWQIERGDILARDYVGRLGTFDVVYSWGVLHHTGDMWAALGNVEHLVAPDGLLCIAIYNDQGFRSRLWRRIKRLYNSLPGPFRTPYAVAVMLPREVTAALSATVRFRPQTYIKTWVSYGRQRGMSRWHDLIDWVGGYPFEVAKPEEIFRFFRRRGFVLQELITCGGGLGNNQFVFQRVGNNAERIPTGHDGR
jgi:2-polyprenyl-3-methyl-5-hydroxy-6-metoxy-1,4-benzoquinol methylase